MYAANGHEEVLTADNTHSNGLRLDGARLNESLIRDAIAEKRTNLPQLDSMQTRPTSGVDERDLGSSLERRSHQRESGIDSERPSTTNEKPDSGLQETNYDIQPTHFDIIKWKPVVPLPTSLRNLRQTEFRNRRSQSVSSARAAWEDPAQASDSRSELSSPVELSLSAAGLLLSSAHCSSYGEGNSKGEGISNGIDANLSLGALISHTATPDSDFSQVDRSVARDDFRKASTRLDAQLQRSEYPLYSSRVVK